MIKLELRILIVSILLLISCGLSAQTAKEKKARERLDMYEIPFTADAFFSYVDKDNSEVVQRFIDAGFDVNTTNQYGDRAIIIAAEKGSNKILDILLKAGADINASDADGSTALMYASYYRMGNTVKLLVKQKADVNLQNRSKMTALMYAIHGGDSECISAVITKETDLSLKNIHGRNAVALARDEGWINVAEYIKSQLDYLNNRQTAEKKKLDIHFERTRKK